MSNDVAVEWGRQIHYCQQAIQFAMNELGAQKLKVPCAETKVHTRAIDTTSEQLTLARTREGSTFERVGHSDTRALERKLTTNVGSAEVEAGGWARPARSVVEIENGVATDGSGVQVVEEMKVTKGVLEGVILMFLKTEDGLGKPSYVHGLAYTDGLGNPLLDGQGQRIFDDHGKFLDPEKAAAYEAFVNKSLTLDRQKAATDPEFQKAVDQSLLVAAAAAGLHEQSREALDGGIEHVVLSNAGQESGEPAAAPKTHSAGEES